MWWATRPRRRRTGGMTESVVGPSTRPRPLEGTTRPQGPEVTWTSPDMSVTGMNPNIGSDLRNRCRSGLDLLLVLTASTHFVVSAGHLTLFRVLWPREQIGICAVERLFRVLLPRGSNPLSSTSKPHFKTVQALHHAGRSTIRASDRLRRRPLRAIDCSAEVFPGDHPWLTGGPDRVAAVPTGPCRPALDPPPS